MEGVYKRFMNSQKFLTIKELSGHLNVSVYTLYAWVRKDRIPYLKLNGLLRFDEGDIEKWLENNRSNGEGERDNRHG